MSHGHAKKKRRRPSKKLVATLESLADALPELTGADGNADELARGKVRHKSLRTRPGGLGRKERLMRAEMARFGASLSQLGRVAEGAGAREAQPGGGDMDVDDVETREAGRGDSHEGGSPVSKSSTANRWAALRGFIAATMERSPAFTRDE